MRFGNLAGRLVLLSDEGAIDPAAASGGRLPADPQEAYDRWDELLDWVARGEGEPQPYDEAMLGPAVPRPTQVFAIGLNYAEHAAEARVELPRSPQTFTKFQSSIAAPHTTVSLPSTTVDWEVEVVAVIGRRAHRVDTADGWSHVAGLSVGQDLSDRAVQMRPPIPQFCLGKSYPGFSPIGPAVVTIDEFDDPDDLAISCKLNGETMQEARTSDLIFSIPALVSELSSVVPLLPGDVIFTGTPPGIGAARTPKRFLHPGDELRSTVQGVGTITTRFEAGPSHPSLAAGAAPTETG